MWVFYKIVVLATAVATLCSIALLFGSILSTGKTLNEQTHKKASQQNNVTKENLYNDQRHKDESDPAIKPIHEYNPSLTNVNDRWKWEEVDTELFALTQDFFDVKFLLSGTTMSRFDVSEVVSVDKVTLNECFTVYRGIFAGTLHHPAEVTRLQSWPAFAYETAELYWNSTAHCPDLLRSSITMQQFTKNKTNLPLWVVIPHKNYTPYLTRTLAYLSHWPQENLKVVVVDFKTTQGNVSESIESSALKDVHLISVDEPFSRAKSLHLAMQYITSFNSTEMGTVTGKDSRVFFLDTSIELPSDFASKIEGFTICNHTVYLPVVKKILDLHSHQESLYYSGKQLLQRRKRWFWVQWGYGMISFCASDYYRVGGINLAFGNKWGGEDVEFASRFQKHGYRLIRRREENYFHNQYKDYHAKLYKQNSNKIHFQRPTGIPDTVMVPESYLVHKQVKSLISPVKGRLKIYRIAIHPEELLAEHEEAVYLVTNKAGATKLESRIFTQGNNHKNI